MIRVMRYNVVDNGGRYSTGDPARYLPAYGVSGNQGRYGLSGIPGIPCGRQVMCPTGMGFSLKPPKLIRKAARAVGHAVASVAKFALPVAAVVVPGVGTALAAGVAAMSSTGVVSQQIKNATTVPPTGSPVPSIASSAGSSAVQPAGLATTPSWVLPALGVAALFMLVGPKPRSSRMRKFDRARARERRRV